MSALFGEQDSKPKKPKAIINNDNFMRFRFLEIIAIYTSFFVLGARHVFVCYHRIFADLDVFSYKDLIIFRILDHGTLLLLLVMNDDDIVRGSTP